MSAIGNVQETLNERANTHGSFMDNGLIMQALKNCMRNFGRNWPHAVSMNDQDHCTISNIPNPENRTALSSAQAEALEMIQHKIGRILSGNPNEPDHWRDIAGYATLVENILTTGQSHIAKSE